MPAGKLQKECNILEWVVTCSTYLAVMVLTIMLICLKKVKRRLDFRVLKCLYN